MAGIEIWVIADIFVFPVCFFWNITGLVLNTGGLVIIKMQACCCIPKGNYLHTSVATTELDFFTDPKGGGGIVKVG